MLILHISFKTWVLLPSMRVFQMSCLMLRRPERFAPSSTSNKKSWSPGICPQLSNPNSSSGSHVIKSSSQSWHYSGSPTSGSLPQTSNLSSLSPVIPSVSLVPYFWYPFYLLHLICPLPIHVPVFFPVHILHHLLLTLLSCHHLMISKCPHAGMWKSDRKKGGRVLGD